MAETVSKGLKKGARINSKPAKVGKSAKAAKKPPKPQMTGVDIDAIHKKVKTGRPSKYDPKIAEIICEQLSEGVPLRQICRENEGFPAWRTVYDWMAKDDALGDKGAGLSASIARARDIGYDSIAEECLHIADNQTITERVTETEDPKTGAILRSVIRSDDVNARRLQVETRLKLLAKFNPKKYGERAILAGDAENPIKIEAESEAKALLEALLKNVELTKQANG
jgi:hypothetical protein